MPNKDSFTFSDKLRKSKSVPLSKRLPSIVGGQDKQKRTLVQRAQRDLPFILVAALALLLLPFLSRNGGDDSIPGPVSPWEQDTTTTTYVDLEGNEIMPNGTMRDPIDMIVGVRRGIDSSSVVDGEATKNAYGATSGSDSSSRYNSYSSTSTKRTPVKDDYQTRKSYEESYQSKTTKKPATSIYGKKTQAGVRKSFERKGTDINRALRLSQIPGGKGVSGLSHNLPIGEGPKRTPSNYNNPGVRPVALQPMEAKGGVGRSMTGENLYAEASRSIGAMNAGGPAKQNLLSAQMRDVDGKLTADGPGFGGPGLGASVRPGAGGNPSNTNGYHFDKPWWWDMMNSRSQKMWELRYYKPREIFWNNLYNYGSQLMNCLATGDKGGDVSAMFGRGGSTDDYICVDPITHEQIAGTIKASKHAKRFSNTTKSGTKDSSETSTDSGSAYDSWERGCIQKGGMSWSSGSSDTGFFGVRAECVGLDVLIDRMKSWVKKEYTSNCDAVTIDGINNYTVDVKKKGLFSKELKYNDRLSRKAVIALIAKVRDQGPTDDTHTGFHDGNEYVVEVVNSNSFTMTNEQIKEWNKNHLKCKLSKLVSFISSENHIKVKNEVKNLSKKKPIFGDKVSFSEKYCQNLDKVNKRKALTFAELKNELEPKKNSVNQCPIPSPSDLAKEMKLDGKKCNNFTNIVPISIDKRPMAEAIIGDPSGQYVYAIGVEQLTNMTEPEVRYVVDYGQVFRSYADKNDVDTYGYEYDNNANGFHFYFDTNLAVQGLDKPYGTSTKNTDKETTNTVRGDGKIFWIVTSEQLNIKTGSEQLKGKSLLDIRSTDFAKDSGTTAICHYRWCEDVDTCSLLQDNNIGNSNCREGNDLYIAQEVTIGNNTYYLKGDEKLQGNFSEDTPECSKLCYKDGQVYPCQNDTPEDQSICNENDPKVSDLIQAGFIKPCPSCCKYNYGNTYNGKFFKSVEIKGKHYIINANPIESCDSENTCTVAAWSEGSNLFAVHDMENLDNINYSSGTLPLIPTDNNFKTATTNDSPAKTVNLSLVNQLYNTIFEEHIKGQSENNNGGPTMFELFPKLELSTDSDRNNLNTVDLSSCVFYGKALYENAYFEASHDDIQTISDRMRVCLKNIKKYEKAGATKSVEKLKNIYFYGYASKRGSHQAGYLTDSLYVGCTTSDADARKGLTDAQEPLWGNCNKALSEDRNLYIMNNVLEELRDDNLGIGVDESSIARFQHLKGFSDTKPENLTNENYRYTGKPQADGQEFIFISKPCGSVGAKYDYNASVDDARKDRYVLIAPIDSNGNECTNRMTIEGVTDELNKIAQEIAQEIQSAKKSKNSPTPSKVRNTPTRLGFGTKNTGLVSRQEEEAIELTFSPDFKNMIKNFKDDVAKTNSTSLLDARSFSEATRILNNQKSAEDKLAAKILEVAIIQDIGESGLNSLRNYKTNKLSATIFDLENDPLD